MKKVVALFMVLAITVAMFVGCGCFQKRPGTDTNTDTVTNTDTNTNTNTNVNAGVYGLRAKNKWVAFLLCFFLGCFGAHKLYEGRTGMGILYLLTVGLFGIGWFVDCIVLLFKPNPYFVR